MLRATHVIDLVTRLPAVTVIVALAGLYFAGLVPLAAYALTSLTASSIIPVLAAGWLLGLGLSLVAGVAFLASRVRDLTAELGYASVELGHTSEELGHTTELLTKEQVLLQKESSVRTRLDRSLEDTKAELATLMQTVPAAILRYDMNGTVVAAEGVGMGTFIPHESLVGRRIEDLAAAYPSAATNVRRALNGEEFTVVEELADHRVETNYSPLRVAGAVTGALAVAVDLRERDRAEQKIRESDERSQRMFDEAPIGSAFVALDGRILVANRLFGEALGQTPKVLGGIQFSAITYPEDVALDTKLHERLLQGEIPSYRVEKRLIRKDGDSTWMEITVTALRDSRARPIYELRMVRPVTGERRDQQLMEHYSRHDAITDLPNRILLEERLEELVAKMRSEQQRLALVLFDVDNLATITERVGRGGRDALLHELAQHLRGLLSDADTFARVGREDFALVLPRRGAAGTAQLAEQILAGIEQGLPVGGQPVQVELRLGFAMFPEDADDCQHLIRRADAALLYAKRNGRRYTRYVESMRI